MPKLNISITHRLASDEALKRVKRLLGEVKTQFSDKIGNLQERWDGNIGTFSFSVKGFSVSGTLVVDQREIAVSGNLPFAATFFKQRIEETIRQHAEKLLT
jgi:hypothetical protein